MGELSTTWHESGSALNLKRMLVKLQSRTGSVMRAKKAPELAIHPSTRCEAYTAPEGQRRDLDSLKVRTDTSNDDIER
jgi:hypothetical protein